MQIRTVAHAALQHSETMKTTAPARVENTGLSVYFQGRETEPQQSEAYCNSEIGSGDSSRQLGVHRQQGRARAVRPALWGRSLHLACFRPLGQLLSPPKRA